MFLPNSTAELQSRGTDSVTQSSEPDDLTLGLKGTKEEVTLQMSVWRGGLVRMET